MTAATLNVSGANIPLRQSRQASALRIPPCCFTSRLCRLPAKANMAGRESGENFKPMEWGFGKNGFGGSCKNTASQPVANVNSS